MPTPPTPAPANNHLEPVEAIDNNDLSFRPPGKPKNITKNIVEQLDASLQLLHAMRAELVERGGGDSILLNLNSQLQARLAAVDLYFRNRELYLHNLYSKR